MIIDTIENISRYASLGANFAAAAAYLAKTDLSALSMGRQEVDGENVYAILQENTLRHGAAWEAHEKYADIQLILNGTERFGWGVAEHYTPLDESRDFMGCEQVKGFDVSLTPGQFVIFMPREPHAPCQFDTTETCRKLVIKIKA